MLVYTLPIGGSIGHIHTTRIERGGGGRAWGSRVLDVEMGLRGFHLLGEEEDYGSVITDDVD